MVLCPVCGVDVDNFYRVDGKIYCPVCKNQIKKNQLSREVQQFIIDVDKLPWDTASHEENNSSVFDDADAGMQDEQQQVTQQAKKKTTQRKKQKQPITLFDVPKQPEEIVAEVLSDHGCTEEFIRGVVRYIQRKGFLDPAWLFQMLLKGRTGRKFTEMEAYMVVDEIISAIEQEKQKAEAVGRPFFFPIVGRPESQQPMVFGQPIQFGQQQPNIYQFGRSFQNPQPNIYAQQPQYTGNPITTLHQPSMWGAQQPALNPAAIESMMEEKIQRAIEKLQKENEFNKLKDMISELAVKLKDVEHKTDEKVMSLKQELSGVLQDFMNQVVQHIKSKPEDVVTKDDLEKLFQKQENELLKEKLNIERQLAEHRIKMLEEQMKHQMTALASVGEGWQDDKTRLIAQLGSQALKIIEERRPLEYIVRILPQPQQQKEKPKEEVKSEGEKSIVDMIKEMGGEVE